MEKVYTVKEFMIGNTTIRVHTPERTQEEIDRRDARIAEVAWEIIHQARAEGRDV